MYRPTPLVNTNIIFQALLFFVLLACENGNQDVGHDTSDTKIDSVQLWIKNSKQHTLSTTGRRLFAQKALSLVDAFSQDTLKSKYYSELSYALFKLNDSLLFRTANTKAIEFALKTKDSTKFAEANWDLAGFFEHHTVQDSSYYHYGEAEKIYSALGDAYLSGRLLYNMARAQLKIKDYTGSEVTTIKAIEKFKPLNKHKNLYQCYNLLGIVTSSLNEHQRALEYFKQALPYLRKTGSNRILEQQLKNNISMVYKEQGRHLQAIAYATEVLRFDSLRSKKPDLFAKALANLGYNKMKLGATSDLPQLFNQALEIQDSIGDRIGQSLTTYNLAEYYLIKKDTAAALASLQRSKLYAQQSSNNEILLKSLQLFPKLDPKNTTKHTQEYIALSDALNNNERQIRDKFARIRFETDEFIAENQDLARQKQLWSGIAVALGLLGLSTFVIFNQRTRNKALQFRQEQQASNEKIFNLMLTQSEKLNEGRSEAQKRISEDLHDSVLSKLLGARMLLIGLNKRSDEAAISERSTAIVAIQDVETEVRTISHNLSNAAYEKMHNFILSIQDSLNSFEKASKIAIDFRHTKPFDWDSLSGNIKVNAYYMVQETMQNALKHAQCQKITVNFQVDGLMLKININDDGKGFMTNTKKKGIGLRNMRSRIKKVNGTYAIDSEVGKGTEVSFVIPIVTNENNRFDSEEEIAGSIQEI